MHRAGQTPCDGDSTPPVEGPATSPAPYTGCRLYAGVAKWIGEWAPLRIKGSVVEPYEVLAEAGLAPPPTNAQSARPSAVLVGDVVAAIDRQHGHFTQHDLRTATGASPMTVRKAVGEQMAHGKVRRIGADPNWSKPGRAPYLYENI